MDTSVTPPKDEVDRSVSRVLNRCLKEARKSNPRISLRAFAKRIGLSHSALSEILKGKRQISKKRAEKLADALKLPSSARSEFLSDYAWESLHRTRPRKLRRHRLDDSTFRLLSSWKHFAILSLAETSDFTHDPSWIASRLGISERAARSALLVLESLKLIIRKDNGSIELRYPRLSSSDDSLNLAIQRSHIESMRLAQAALESQPVDKRYFSSMTIALPSEKIPVIKELIRMHLNQVDSLSGDGPKNDVYKLNIQFFPLTRDREKSSG